MQTKFPLIGQGWRNDLNNKRYSFLLSDNPTKNDHHHTFFELGYLLRGEIDHQIHGISTHMKAGDFYFVDIGVSHQYHGTPNTQMLNFMFFPEAIDPAFAGYKNLTQITNSPFFRFNSNQLPLLTRPCFHDGNGKLLQILQDLQEEIIQRQPGHHQMIQSMIQQIVIHLMRADNHISQLADENSTIFKITRIIEEQYTSNITVKSIAEQLGYSAVHISRIFKERLNISFTEYLQRYRLSQSCRFLAQTDWSIAKVAEEVGYQNVQFYHRLFKRYYHNTPLQYRKNRHKI